MPKTNKQVPEDLKPKLVCPHCGDGLKKTLNTRTQEMGWRTEILQERWLCPRGHEYWRNEEVHDRR